MVIKLLALAVSVFVLAFISVYSPLFEIKDVSFNDENECIEDPQGFASANLVGKSLIFFDPQKIANDIKAQFTCVDSISIDRKFPSSLEIDVKSQVPVAKIADSEFQITEGGLIINASDKYQVPTLFLPQGTSITQRTRIMDENVLKVLSIAKNLLKSDFNSSNIRILENNQIAIYSTSEMLVIFSSKKEAKGQVDTLQQILSEAKIDATKIEKIDMSFEKPVISYK